VVLLQLQPELRLSTDRQEIGIRARPALPAGRLKIANFMYNIYAIKSLRRNYIYFGITDDLERRIT